MIWKFGNVIIDLNLSTYKPINTSTTLRTLQTLRTFHNSLPRFQFHNRYSVRFRNQKIN